MVVGVAVVGFNRQLVAKVHPLTRRVPPWRRLIDDWKIYQPSATGRVPMLTIIGMGWVLVGRLFVWVAVTNQPL